MGGCIVAVGVWHTACDIPPGSNGVLDPCFLSSRVDLIRKENIESGEVAALGPVSSGALGEIRGLHYVTK